MLLNEGDLGDVNHPDIRESNANDIRLKLGLAELIFQAVILILLV